MLTPKGIRGCGTVNIAVCVKPCSMFTACRCLGGATCVPGELASARNTPYMSGSGTALPGSARRVHRHRPQAWRTAACVAREHRHPCRASGAVSKCGTVGGTSSLQRATKSRRVQHGLVCRQGACSAASLFSTCQVQEGVSRLHKHAASNCGFAFGRERPCTASGLVRHVKHGAEGVMSPAAQHAKQLPLRTPVPLQWRAGRLSSCQQVEGWEGQHGFG